MQIAEFSSHLAITSGDSLLLFDPISGASRVAKVPPPEVPPNLAKGQLEVLNRQDRTINCVAVSRDGEHVGVATENKQIVIFDSALNVAKNFIVSRAASKLLFTKGGGILVADRTGDVYLYESSEPVLLLGHLSMILDMALSECEKYIVTCDRDEKIRVSHFPNTYNIVSFCLGHDEFVTCIKLIGGLLVSGSGDGTVRIWDYVKGQQLSVIDTNENIGDKNLLEEFSETMDKEKVDVTALPITDMQVCCKNNDILVAVSVHNCAAIQLYTLDCKNYEYSVKIISAVPKMHKFYLTPCKMYVFNESSASLYESRNDSWSFQNDSKLDAFRERHKHIFRMSDYCVTVLYKRKFDNVQEYLERKKLRLESGK